MDHRRQRRIALDELAAEPRRRLSEPYYSDLYAFVRQVVPPDSRVLDLGCGDGDLLASLVPSIGVGVDLSATALRRARARHPGLTFVQADCEHLPIKGSFDYVVASNVLGYLGDVQSFLVHLRGVMGPQTRLVLTYYNFLWEPLLRLTAAIGLTRKEPLQNWLSKVDIENLLELADLAPVHSGWRSVLPAGPPRIVATANRVLGAIPLVRRLGLTSYATARLLKVTATPRRADPTCTVVIPTRNEKGNIRAAVTRIPRLGSHTEVIFIDGNSTDGTVDEIESAIADHPELDLKLLHQGAGRGKGDAVRQAFEKAAGEVLIILDADLTVAPEDLPKFWDALVGEKGEFINGSRLVYPMESQAMRLANIAGNKLFGALFSWILDQRVTDTLCGTKVLWAADYQNIAANRHVFGNFDPFGDFDLLFGAANLGLHIRELPVRYGERTYGRSNISRWRHGVLLARMAVIGARKLRLR